LSSLVVGFAGLTHLGLVSAVATASKGLRVVGYDADGARVREIAARRMPVVEPELDDLARRFAAQLKFSDWIGDLTACDVVYIAADVATDDRGQSDLSEISALIEKVIPALAPSALLCILCQVPPGFTRRLPVDPARLFYQVETLVFGRAVERATKPERFIVGCADPAKPLPQTYAAVLEAFGCPILSMRYESAELAKIAINCCLVASVSVANTLADLSERIGADWHEIVPALRLDRRIGPYSYLVPGLGIAGGNLERDLATVLRLAEATGSEASLIAAFVANSRTRRDWVLRLIHREVLPRNAEPTFGILGLAYKENTHSTKNSPSLALIENLKPWPIRVYDPVVPGNVVPHPAATAAGTALEAARGSDALLIMTPWPQFRALVPADLANAMTGRVVVDPFRVLEPAAVRAAGLSYFTLGAPAAANARHRQRC
jgi:UDPglucose 6-dehydrogenase